MEQPKIHCLYDDLVHPQSLKDYPKNRNKHPQDQLVRLAKIIEYNGWRWPIKVSKRSGFITSGHGRKWSAISQGWEKVPVVYQDYESEDHEYADVQADNAIASWAELDLAGINMDLQDLGPDFDIDLLGIKDFVLEPAEKFEGLTDEDSVPENAETRVKLGDVWKLGNHRLMCGDSTKIDDVEKLMGGEKADMLFTDPPYGVDYSGGIQFTDNGIKKNNRRKLENDHSTSIYKEVSEVIPIVVDGPCYIWFAFSKAKDTIDAIDAIDAIGEIHALLIWNKTNATYGALNACYKQRHEPCIFLKTHGSTLRWSGPTNECTVWDLKRDSVNDLHPTQKPVALAERAINNHDAKTVLDLFGGSGSTLIACEKTGRKCFMMELDPHYCDVIVKRWEDFTGKPAERIDG